MLTHKLASTFAALFLSGLFATTGLSTQATAGTLYGDGQMVAGVSPEHAPQPGRYGGGLIEFLITGRSGPAQMPSRGLSPAQAYASSMPYADPDQYAPETGYEAAPAGYQAGPAGYAMPRRPMNPIYQRQEVEYAGPQGPGTIVVDTTNKFLYLVEGGGQALRYGIGVGKEGFLWHGVKNITRKAEWPGWTPPAEMIRRRPDLPSHMDGGIANPLGARAMYLGDTLYRIHGTNEPDTIGTNVSSGCIRLTNDDVSDLFGRVKVGTKVVVM